MLPRIYKKKVRKVGGRRRGGPEGSFDSYNTKVCRRALLDP